MAARLRSAVTAAREWLSGRQQLRAARSASRVASRARVQAERKTASLEADLREARSDHEAALRELALVRGENEVLKAQVEMTTRWIQREMERLERETAMQAALKVSFTTGGIRERAAAEELSDGRVF